MRQRETIKTLNFYFNFFHFLLLSHFKPTGACDSPCHTMMSSYEEQCSLTSTPGRAAYRRRASGPERSDGHTNRTNTRSILLLIKISILILKDTKINTHTNKNINNKTNDTNKYQLVIDHVYLCLVAAASTLICVCPRVGDGHQSTQVTHMNLIWIRRLEKTFSKELSCSMSNLTVTLHLPKPQAAITVRQTGESERSLRCNTDR